MPNAVPMMTLASELRNLTIAEMLRFPDKKMLKFSNRYFDGLRKPLSFEQLIVKSFGKSDSLKDFLPCDDYHRLRPNAEFERGGMHKRGWFCFECEVQKKRGGYKIGDRIKVSYGHVLCRQYEEFKDAIPRKVEDLCQHC